MHNINLVLDSVQKLESNNIKPWLFWWRAEELLEVIKPRDHHDIDLLYPAENFDILETFIYQNNNISEIEWKKFSHKRAILLDNVMIEFFLLQKVWKCYSTNFFGKYTYIWPENTLSEILLPNGIHLNIASKEAIAAYRKIHPILHKQ